MDNTTAKVEVESYYDAVHRKSLMRRFAGLMAGTTVGAAFGAVIGVVAAFLPAVLGVIGVAGASAVAWPALAAVAVSAATFAGAGGAMGLAAIAAVGETSGAVAAGFEEKEKREKLEKLQSPSQATPSSQIPNSVQFISKKSPEQPSGKFFNWKVVASVAALFAVFGAMLAISPVAAPAVALLGFEAGTVAGVVASAAVMGMVGAVASGNFPALTNKLSNAYSKLLTAEVFDRKPVQQETIPLPSRETEKVIDGQGTYETMQPTRSFTEKEKRFSLESILDQSQDNNTVRTR